MGFVHIPELDSRHAQIEEVSAVLEQGTVPPGFEAMADQVATILGPVLKSFDTLIVHNVLTKHFNLPLTAALFRLLDAGIIGHGIAWCHDFTWTSPSSSAKVHPGYPWDLLRTYRPDLTYVVVSGQRQGELASLLGCPAEHIHVVYNGVDGASLLGLSVAGQALVRHLDLLSRDLVLLMPVRVTQAKNIEYALEVVAALRARGCCPALVVTGPPDPHDSGSMAYYRSLQALRQQLGVEEQVRFVYESGPEPGQGHIVGSEVVGDLFRVSDLMFMPSHREGFAMPVLEAGLAGIPVVCTEVPAAVEIGGPDVLLFDKDDHPDDLAARILTQVQSDPVHRLRRRVRQNYTWQAILERDIEPLLRQGEGA
jgi:glycosyltransferase involved in cell wall biosynthesis